VELIDWVGLFFALTPLWAGLFYGLMRLTGRWPRPDGVPPGRYGGMGHLRVPGGDAPAYGHKLKREADEHEDGDATA
jgi:hypothetical protein